MEETFEQTFVEKNMISIGSFIIGTLLFIAYLITKSNKLLLPGLLYLLFSIVINIVHLFATIIFHFHERRKIKDTLIRIGLILINIPIAYLYTKMALYIFKH